MKIKLSQLLDSVIPKEKPPKLDPEKMAKLKNASEAVLWALTVAGGVGIAIIAPGLFIGLGALLEEKYPGKEFSYEDKKRQLAKTFYYLKKHKYVRMKLTKSDIKCFLTRNGRRKLKRISIAVLGVEKRGRWDKKWWQVAADIPTEKYKWAADRFREKLKEMRFYPLQRTLWLYPFDPRREVEFLTNYFGIGRFVTVMEVNRLDRDDERLMMKYFKKQRVI